MSSSTLERPHPHHLVLRNHPYNPQVTNPVVGLAYMWTLDHGDVKVDLAIRSDEGQKYHGQRQLTRPNMLPPHSNMRSSVKRLTRTNGYTHTHTNTYCLDSLLCQAALHSNGTSMKDLIIREVRHTTSSQDLHFERTNAWTN